MHGEGRSGRLVCFSISNAERTFSGKLKVSNFGDFGVNYNFQRSSQCKKSGNNNEQLLKGSQNTKNELIRLDPLIKP